jgi:hypothetical protein
MIEVEKASGFPVSVACELLGVSRSGYHDWETRSPSDRELTDAWLTEKIKAIHLANRGVYGAPGSTRSCGWLTASVWVANGWSG